jgi:Spy/CpxP family protein refolding chaperone
MKERITMNKKITILALALALPLTVAAYPGGGDGGRFEGHRGDRVERLDKELDLNPEQKSKLESIFKEQREKFAAIHQETRARMQEVLSAEQMTKLDALKQRRHEQWQKRHAQWQNQKPSDSQN